MNPSVNPWRGEVSLSIDGTPYVLKLTLGALAELEAALGADSLLELVVRFEEGRFRASDLLALLAAGLRGAGAPELAQGLSAARIDGGAVAAAQAAAQLLQHAFALPPSS